MRMLTSDQTRQEETPLILALTPFPLSPAAPSSRVSGLCSHGQRDPVRKDQLGVSTEDAPAALEGDGDSCLVLRNTPKNLTPTHVFKASEHLRVQQHPAD